MYRVLLADDDRLDLEGMRAFIPWKQLGMEVAGAVGSGFAAVEVLESQAIDVLVTDIRMPNMSGLELAKRAREKQRELRVIFVSGHQDFHYAKQAMTLNAFGYVLKPMDDKELIEALTSVKLELDQDRAQREKEETFRQLAPIARNEYLLQLLESAPESISIAAISQEFHVDRIKGPIRVLLLEIDDFTWKLNPYSREERHVLLNQFYSTLADYLGRLHIEHVCRISKSRTALLLGGETDWICMPPFLAQVAREFPFTITIGTGKAVNGPDGLHAAYLEAQSALKQKMLRGKGRILFYEENIDSDLEDVRGLDVHLEAMLKGMAGYDLVRIHDELSKLFELVSQLGSRITIHHFAMYVVMKLNDFLRGMNEDLYKLLGLELKNLDTLLQFETIDDIHSWLRRRAFELSEMIQAKKHSKNGKLVQSLIDDIKERLNENITLRDVAERFSFSPNHLGLLFKEETGRNFSDYVIDLRMEKAQQLLRDTKLKIYEIADKIGYRYLPYFSRQFKETTGMTPLEYRRNN